jgi:hypothetical protein
MKLKSHGRYDYSAITERKDYSWPGGKRLARAPVPERRALFIRRRSWQRLRSPAAADTIERHEDKRPLGWLAPYISQTQASPDLLREAGFRYPYAHDLNDSLEAVSRRTPSQLYCENLIDHFDEMLEGYVEALPAGTVPGGS